MPTRRRRILQPRYRFLLWVAPLITLTLMACQQRPSGSIVLDREVLLRGKPGTPYVITRMPDGDFVVAGDMGAAWAVRTGPNGEVRWQFKDTRELGAGNSSQSQFKGAVALRGGNVLLCGTKDTADGNFGFLVFVGPSGQVLEQRLALPNRIEPNQSQAASIGSFSACIPWGDGVALLGSVWLGSGSGGWLTKLDNSGRPQWEKVGLQLPAVQMIEMADHGLVLADNVDLVRLDAVGKEVARRRFSGTRLDLLRSIEPADSVRLILHSGPGEENVTLISLDSRLSDAAPPRKIGQYSINFGRGYVLPDGSTALFGQVGTDPKPAIIKLGPPGVSDAVTVYPPALGAFAVRDAVPLSDTQFVAVRTQLLLKRDAQGRLMLDSNRLASLDEDNSGVVLTWVTFK